MKVGKSVVLQVCGVAICVLGVSPTIAQSDNASDRAKSRLQELIEYWTPERRAAAQPRDLVLDSRGLAYMKGRNGVLTPYGHSIAALNSERPTKGKPSNGDSTPPAVADMSPMQGSTIGSSSAFTATVTDASGIKSVSFEISRIGGLSQSFSASAGSNDTYGANLSGFTDGSWQWRVVARDNGPKGGNTTTTDWVNFDVSVDGNPGDGGDGGSGTGDGIITNSRWTAGGDIQNAAGRLLYEMPNLRGNRIRSWSAYVCSGTVVSDGNSGRSIIVTAAHCVYDDVAKKFARNVIFIPNQDGTDGAGTDWNCDNDPLGCWAPDFGVVDTNWTTATFPDNIPWDYAYYVALGSGGKSGGQLDAAVNGLSLIFKVSPSAAPQDGARTYALGYSYSDDPNFMHCAENLDGSSQSPANWWLPSCELSGGSSGGPWVQSTDDSLGNGPIMSVNSWGYQGSPGMAGPKLNGTTASCLFDRAEMDSPISPEDGEAGLVGC